ncbi:unnamed protein product [Linum tenue]|uniref:Secreted protein n=1 Tax=Linum tenue TaxID=586396 RepID=A0AAV0H6L8_9ROSI|nr:unnamed protein product [Linum tenue]
MKPSSKIASRMCSSHFLSLGLCFCSENPILPLLARNWLKNQDFPTHTGRPHGRVAHPVARVSQSAPYQLSRSSGFPHGQGRTGVWDFHPARVCSRRKSHGHNCQLHGRVMSRTARAASLAPRHASDLRPIDPKLAPKPPFTY